MQIKISRDYSVSFTEDELVDAICYWLSNYRSTTETTQVCSLIRNAPGGVDIEFVHDGSGVTLGFTYADEIEYED